MQPLRGTKDILPSELKTWHYIRKVAENILNINSYNEIQTPILESTELFLRSIGNFTDIVNKEMYSFLDQGDRKITLRPEGTACIARAIISNKLYLSNKANKLWYIGPMFRYERPQKGRQRQFHQLGIEYIGSESSIADVEVIKIANQITNQLNIEEQCVLELNSIGNIQEREKYKINLVEYLNKYRYELDIDSQSKIDKNPLRILDSKVKKTQEILKSCPTIKKYLGNKSISHFEDICTQLDHLNIKYRINNYLVRGLDYYNYTAFEIKDKRNSGQNTICGGGRYDQLIQQLGGPNIPSVGCAIGIERIVRMISKQIIANKISENNSIYIATQNLNNYKKDLLWDVISILEENKVRFELDLNTNNLGKQIKKAHQKNIKICLILGEEEINSYCITVKWLSTSTQQKIHFSELRKYIKYIKKM